MVDHDLLARAVKAGLVLGRCPGEHFQNGFGEWCCDRYSVDDGYLPCARCGGTGEDTTPWAIVGAVRMSTDHIEIARAIVSVVVIDVTGAHRADVPHDGTTDGIRDAALLAFCRAREEGP